MSDFVSNLLTSASMLAVASAASVFAPRLSRRFLPPVRRDRLRDHIGFERVLTNDYIRIVDGSLVATLQVDGQDVSSKTDEYQDKAFLTQQGWLNEMEDFPGTVRVFSRKHRLDKSGDASPYEQEWQRAVMETWLAGFARAYSIQHTIVLSIRGETDQARDKLQEAVERSIMLLHDFGCRVMPLGDAGRESPLLTFWAQLLNPGAPISVHPTRGTAIQDRRVVGPLDRRLADQLTATEVLFCDGRDHKQENGLIRFKRGAHDVWAAVVGITIWSTETSPNIINEVLSADAELVVVQIMRVFDQHTAMAILGAIKRNSSGTGRTMEQLAAVEALYDHKPSDADAQRLVRHQLNIFVYGETPEDVSQRTADVQMRLQDCQCRSVVDTWCAETAWFTQFPPHGDMDATVTAVMGMDDHHRPMLPMTSNVAHLVTMETPPQGRESSVFGDRAITYLKSATGAPYGFTWHKPGTQPGELTIGNTLMFGGMGSGKTVVMLFLLMASLGHENTYAFMSDRRDGAYVGTKAFGGRYVHLVTDIEQVGDVAELAPLKMDFSADANGVLCRQGEWLRLWITQFLARIRDDAAAEQEIAAALGQMAEVSRTERSVDVLLNGLSHNTAARRNLARWATGGAYGRTFNGARDTLAFDEAHRWVTFDFTRALSDPTLIGALVPYLAYRIESAMVERGANWMLALDEAAALIADPVVAKWYMELHQEVRKLRGLVISAFQRVSSLTDISEAQREVLLGNSSCIICFPNESADPSEYMGLLGLTPSELDIVRGGNRFARRNKRHVLLKKRGEGSLVLEVDLGPLRHSPRGDLLRLFDSGPDAAALYRRCEAEYGERGAAEAYLHQISGGRVRALGTVEGVLG